MFQHSRLASSAVADPAPGRLRAAAQAPTSAWPAHCCPGCQTTAPGLHRPPLQRRPLPRPLRNPPWQPPRAGRPGAPAPNPRPATSRREWLVASRHDLRDRSPHPYFSSQLSAFGPTERLRLAVERDWTASRALSG